MIYEESAPVPLTHIVRLKGHDWWSIQRQAEPTQETKNIYSNHIQ